MSKLRWSVNPDGVKSGFAARLQPTNTFLLQGKPFSLGQVVKNCRITLVLERLAHVELAKNVIGQLRIDPARKIVRVGDFVDVEIRSFTNNFPAEPILDLSAVKYHTAQKLPSSEIAILMGTEGEPPKITHYLKSKEGESLVLPSQLFVPNTLNVNGRTTIEVQRTRIKTLQGTVCFARGFFEVARRFYEMLRSNERFSARLENAFVLQKDNGFSSLPNGQLPVLLLASQTIETNEGHVYQPRAVLIIGEDYYYRNGNRYCFRAKEVAFRIGTRPDSPLSLINDLARGHLDATQLEFFNTH